MKTIEDHIRLLDRCKCPVCQNEIKKLLEQEKERKEEIKKDDNPDNHLGKHGKRKTPEI
jgi:hypothetical protein